MEKNKIKDNLKQAKKTIDNLLSMNDDDLQKLFNASKRIKEALRNLNKSSKSIEYTGRKAKVKDNTKWIYAGHTFEILEVYIVHSGEYGIYQKGSMDLRLNLVGTEFEHPKNSNYHNTSTVINTKDLIILD